MQFAEQKHRKHPVVDLAFAKASLTEYQEQTAATIIIWPLRRGKFETTEHVEFS